MEKRKIDREKIKIATRMLIEAIGDDPDREGLVETPRRVAGYWEELAEGMFYTNEEIGNMFKKEFELPTDDLVTMPDINVFSHCEHHLALMYDGDILVGYIPTENSDGTFTLTPTNNNSARDGYIIGDTVYVYAYPKVYFDYKCYPTPSLDSVFGQGTQTVDSYPNGKSVYTVFNSKDTTHSTIQPWIMAGNRNHPEGVPLGSYELKNAETHPFTIFKPDSTSPWYFTVTRDESGFPVIKDKNETITKTITAKYTYLPTGS